MVCFLRLFAQKPSMSHTEIEILIAIVTGILAGIMSEIGGAGGLLALPMLMGLGLPPTVANATNRLGTMSVYTLAYMEFRRNHSIVLRHALIYSLPIIIGALSGAFAATQMSNRSMQWVVIAVTVLMVLFTALGPTLMNKPNATTNASKRLNISSFTLLVAIGAYSGFIEQAMAYLIFFMLVRVLGVEMETARGLKFFLSMILTPFALVIFIIFGNLNWVLGLFVAIGSSTGGWVGALMLDKLSSHAIRFYILLSLGISLVYLLLFILKHYFNYGDAFI